MVDESKIKSAVERLTCSVHHKHPENIQLTSKGFNYTCCCDKFKKEVQEKIKSELIEQAQKDIDDIIRGLKR